MILLKYKKLFWNWFWYTLCIGFLSIATDNEYLLVLLSGTVTALSVINHLIIIEPLQCDHKYRVSRKSIRTLRFTSGEGFVMERKNPFSVNYVIVECRYCHHRIEEIDSIVEYKKK